MSQPPSTGSRIAAIAGAFGLLLLTPNQFTALAGDGPPGSDLIEGLKTSRVTRCPHRKGGCGAASSLQSSAPSGDGIELYFSLDSAEIDRMQSLRLERFLAGKNPTDAIEVDIAGHTDGRGASAYNERLSLQRAIAARDLLIRTFKIPADRISTAGYGKRQPKRGIRPLAPENRRVELVIKT